MSQNTNAKFVSLFVNHAILRALTLGLSTTAVFSLSRNSHPTENGERRPSTLDMVANPVVCVLSAMALGQLKRPITNTASLERAIENIRAMFAATVDFPSIESEAKEAMEYDLGNARKAGLAALEEALAGFPISGGDLDLWSEHLLTNHKSTGSHKLSLREPRRTGLSLGIQPPKPAGMAPQHFRFTGIRTFDAL
jgi:hypothetical protein